MTVKDLARIRDFYLSTQFFEDSFENIVSPLIQCFNSEKGAPLDIENPSDYYTSTTATTLLALFHTNMIDSNLLNEFHEVMFKLRDHTENPIVKSKFQEDSCAWDVSESACVWATGLAIWSLLETGYHGPRMDEIKKALLWLVDQQKPGGGCGFDIRCRSRIYFTGLALHAMKLGLSYLDLNQQETNRINKAIADGIQFILNESKSEGNIVYWGTIEGSKDRDPTSTLYALWALYEHNADQYRAMINKGLQFIRDDLRGKDVWELKEIVSETETKYTTHKVIVSFTPAFPILLLRLGVNPFDEMCIKPIMWLKKNRAAQGWRLQGYSEHALSFTTAFALWTINQWHKHVVKEFLKEHARHPLILKALRNRITTLLGLIIGLILSIAVFLTPMPVYVNNLLTKIVEQYGIGLSVLASLLAVLGISGLVPALKYIDSRFLNHRMKRSIEKLVKAVKHFVYVK